MHSGNLSQPHAVKLLPTRDMMQTHTTDQQERKDH